jgi:hypothetical protein
MALNLRNFYNARNLIRLKSSAFSPNIFIIRRLRMKG